MTVLSLLAMVSHDKVWPLTSRFFQGSDAFSGVISLGVRGDTGWALWVSLGSGTHSCT